jgi:PAS domain S-box-containing protein
MSPPERRSLATVEPFRLLFDECPLPMWVHDAHSLAFLEVNEAASRLYGYTREEFLSLILPDIRKIDAPDESGGRASR